MTDASSDRLRILSEILEEEKLKHLGDVLSELKKTPFGDVIESMRLLVYAFDLFEMLTAVDQATSSELPDTPAVPAHAVDEADERADGSGTNPEVSVPKARQREQRFNPNPEQVEDILNGWQNGEPIGSIAIRYGVTDATIRRYMHANFHDIKKVRSKTLSKRLTEEQKKEISRLHNQGFKTKAIVTQMQGQVNYGQVNQYLVRLKKMRNKAASPVSTQTVEKAEDGTNTPGTTDESSVRIPIPVRKVSAYTLPVSPSGAEKKNDSSTECVIKRPLGAAFTPNDEQIEYILKLVDAGFSYDAIGLRYSVIGATIMDLVHRMRPGFKKMKAKNYASRLTRYQEREIENHFDNGKRPPEISQMLGIGYNQVLNYLRRINKM